MGHDRGHHKIIKIAEQSAQPNREKRGGATRESHWRGQVTRALCRGKKNENME